MDSKDTFHKTLSSMTFVTTTPIVNVIFTKYPKRTARVWIVPVAFIMLLAQFATVRTSYTDEKTWGTRNNGLSSDGIATKNNFQHDRLSTTTNGESKITNKGEGGGTKWATATEEAFDERRDAEILQAVFNSIAEWQERRQNREARKKPESRRTKRSQQEKSSDNDKQDTSSSSSSSSSDDENKDPQKVCYAELGCFQEAGYIDLLPNSPEEVNTRYLLYNSRKSRGDTPLLDVSAQNISSMWEWAGKAFNVSAPTKVIVHGFGSSCSNVWVYEMRSALMSVEDCNIICVDWEAGATIPNYVRAAANTRLVGKQVAILLSGLEKYVNLSVRNVHVIGFSLGAHIAGFAGSELKNLSRITGLDPAGPLFESQDRRARLDSMDAQFVDVIHSNGENLILGGLGAWQPMGHVDFYPNGGRMQKGCTNLFVGAVSDMIWSANEVYGRSLCNHRRAYKFFTDSVSPKCQFPAVPCESYDHFVEGKCFPCENIKDCSNMGYYADKFAGRGTLYLLTRDEEPFCANQYMVKVENSPDNAAADDETKSITFGKIQITLIDDLELNETFVITQKKDEKLVSGESVSRIIVPHPALQHFFKIQILYVAYKGWLSSGQQRWKIDKISLTNSYGLVLSACKNDLVLESGVPVMLQLIPKNCDAGDQVLNGTSTIISNRDRDQNGIEHHNHSTQSVAAVYPHTQVVRIGDEILTMKDSALASLLNPAAANSEWSNSSNLAKRNSSAFIDNNVSKIGVGVTEYIINESWKHKNGDGGTGDLLGEVSAAASVNVGNNLDGVADERNEGRRLSFKPAAAKQLVGGASLAAAKTTHGSSSPITANKIVVGNSTGPQQSDTKPSSSSSFTNANHTPYEFVTDVSGAHPVDSSNDTKTATDSKITEPVLKPKTTTSSVRSRKSQQVYRGPNYGKSMNVNDESAAAAAHSTARKLSAPATTVVGNSSSHGDGDSSETKTTAATARNSTTSSQLFVVQFLPQKLVSFFEQAERYARLAFMPFIAPQSPPSHDSKATAAAPSNLGSRRIRTFNVAGNRGGWIPQTSKNTAAEEKHDMETEESRIVTSVIAVPSTRTTASFPYAYQVHEQHLWQPISQFGIDHKYIPLMQTESQVPSEQSRRRSDDRAR